MPSLMQHIRRALGLPEHEPLPMSDEQRRANVRLERIAQRQKAIDIQREVLRADRRDEQRGLR